MHNQWTANVPASVQIGSIAVANGGKGYWDAWKKACGPSCRIDFIPLHFYGLTSKDFIDYAKVSDLTGAEFISYEVRSGTNQHSLTRAKASLCG